MLPTLLTGMVAILHILFGLGESVGWSRMARRFGYRGEAVEHTRVLALNQGAYNGGIAALIGWALATGQDATVMALLMFVIAMAVVGAVTASWRILVVQGVPAMAALLAWTWQSWP